MYRKVLWLFTVAIIFFAFGLFLGGGKLPYQNFLGRAKVVHSNQFTDQASLQDLHAHLGLVAEQVCEKIYPAPKSLSDCFNTLDHGLARSFDPHTVYRNATEAEEKEEREKDSFQGVGVTIVKLKGVQGFQIRDIVPGGTAEEFGIQAGDEIVSINNVPIAHFSDVYEVARAIRGAPGTHVILQMKHKNEEQIFTASVTRKEIFRPQIESTILLDQGKSYGLIRTRQFGDHFAEELQRVLKRFTASKVAGLIISLENNPGGSLYEVNAALDLFMDAKSFVLEHNRLGVSEISKGGLPHVEGDITHGLPVLVVVNGSSASASEIFASAMQHFGRGLIYGRKTFGKGTMQEVVRLPGGAEMSITIAEYLIGTTDDWITVQCTGVVPDVIHPQDESTKEEPSECTDDQSIISGGGMVNPPVHRSFRELHPDQYKTTLSMIALYEAQEHAHKKKP